MSLKPGGEKNKGADELSRKLFAILGVKGFRSCVDNFTRAVGSKLKEKNLFRTPIKLSRVASEFKIKPSPRFCDLDSEGQLVFDRAASLFEIWINTSRNTPGTIYGLRRKRFTYAHEFAHRFFSGEEGERLCNKILDEIPKKQQIIAIPKLLHLEEKLCNAIGASLLVPEEMLFPQLIALFSQTRDCETFYQSIENLANIYNVSDECMLFRYRDIFNKSATLRSKAPFFVYFRPTENFKGNCIKTVASSNIFESSANFLLPPSELTNEFLKLFEANIGNICSQLPQKGGIHVDFVLDSPLLRGKSYFTGFLQRTKSGLYSKYLASGYFIKK